MRTAGRVSEASDDSLSPKRGSARRMVHVGTVSPIDLPNTVGFIELPLCTQIHVHTCIYMYIYMFQRNIFMPYTPIGGSR